MRAKLRPFGVVLLAAEEDASVRRSDVGVVRVAGAVAREGLADFHRGGLSVLEDLSADLGREGEEVWHVCCAVWRRRSSEKEAVPGSGVGRD